MQAYQEKPTFATSGSTMAYVDSAIANSIQHSLKNYASGSHFRHLIDESKAIWTEFVYGPIAEKAVLYLGPNQSVDGVTYQNAEEYLLSC